MLFLASVRHTKGLGNAAVYLRARNGSGMFYDFINIGWVSTATAATKKLLTEVADDDTVKSGYFSEVTMPAGPILVEYVEASSGSVINSDGNVGITTEILSATSQLVFNNGAVVGVAGAGTVEVTEDYGGVGTLSYKNAQGAGIDNAVVEVYLKTDYDAGDTGDNYIIGRTETNVDGGFRFPLYLDPATYSFVYYKQGVYGPDILEVTIT